MSQSEPNLLIVRSEQEWHAPAETAALDWLALAQGCSLLNRLK